MNTKVLSILICLFSISLQSNGQVPVIQKIERPISFNKSTLIITGSGFSTNSAQLQVWFDQVKGIIKSSSEFSIEVEVPPQARLDNVRVVNLTSKLSAQSDLKFMPVYSGEGFDPAKLDAPKTYPSTAAVFDMISFDVDGDNKPDLVGSRNEATSTTLDLLMNQSTVGNINFVNSTVTSLNINAPTAFLASGDINGDGKTDLVASRDGNTANIVYVLINTSTVGNPSFSNPIILSLEANFKALQVKVEDLNNDGKPEIVVANGTTNELYIFRNESSGGATNINTTPTKIVVTGALETLALDIQDLDRDGKKDIVATRFQSSDLFILKNNSTNTSFSFTITKITSAGSYRDLETVDFNNDGKLDIIAISIFNAQAHVFLNQSTSNAIAFTPFPIILTTDSQPFSIDVSDLNGDGFADFIVASRGVATLTAFISNGNTSALGFSKVVITTNKNNWAVRAGDLDGDAKPDIAFTSFTGTTGPYSVDVLRNKNCHKPRILNDSPLNICGSQTIRLIAVPMPGVTYNWSNGFSSIKNSADPFVDVTVAATYTVTAVRTDGTTSCSVVSNAIVINSGAGSAPAEPVITTNAPICANNTLTLSTTAITGATYSWTGPNNFTANLQNVSIPNATSANAGVYSLTVKVGDCTSNKANKTIDIVSVGSFAISSTSATNTVCEGQSLTLSVNSETGYNYQWLKDNVNISGQTGTTLTVAQSGSYKVKVTNTALGCSQETAPVVVTVLKVPVASFTMPASGCVGNSVSFSNTTVTEITPVLAWDFGDNTTSALANPTHTYATANTFNVKLTVSYSGVTGCSNSVNKNLVIGSPTTPVISASANEICDGEESTLSVTGTFDKYQWSTNETTPTITVATPGEYTVTTTELNTCIGNASFTITAKTDCPVANPELKFPPVFTPNGDISNNRWVIPGIEQFPDCTMNIFDGAGRRVYQVTGYPIEGWDGTSAGKDVPDGTYYFVFGCPNEKPKTGSVLIVR